MPSSRRSAAGSSVRSDGNTPGVFDRLNPMRTIALVIALGLVLVSCGGGEPTADDPSDSEAIYAAALKALVEDDNTFGGGGNPFNELLVQSSLDPTAGSRGLVDDRPLTAGEQAAIEAALSPLAPVRWIDDPDEWRTEDLRPTIDGAAILGVGEITYDENGALVPMSMWCGGLCGTWFTYRVSPSAAGWEVVGIEGPIAVS